MDRKELITQMKSYTGACFISKKQLADFMGYKSVNSVAGYLTDLERLDNKYFIPEVADSLMRAKQ